MDIARAEKQIPAWIKREGGVDPSIQVEDTVEVLSSTVEVPSGTGPLSSLGSPSVGSTSSPPPTDTKDLHTKERSTQVERRTQEVHGTQESTTLGEVPQPTQELLARAL
ncbi:MAG: hypothetical protein ACFFC6_18490 [Promethearchaeota archaeon]